MSFLAKKAKKRRGDERLTRVHGTLKSGHFSRRIFPADFARK
jgi:hypothetical protein